MEAQYPHLLVCHHRLWCSGSDSACLDEDFCFFGIAGSAEYYLLTAVDLTCWGGYFLFTALQEHCQAKAIRALNNTVRDGLYHSFLRKSHTDFHQSDTGEYLARLTNDIKQLEQLAWIPFFGCVGRIA